MKVRKFILGFIVIDLLFMLIGIYSLLKPDKEYKQTQGIIVDLIEEYDPINEITTCQTIIDYAVDNVEYKNIEYGAYNSSMKIGDKVIVYYDEDDPSLIQAEGYQKVPYIFIGVSFVFLLISVITFIKSK